MKPQLADNWLEDKQRLPAWQQPKYDGVRGLFLTDRFTGRSLKPFKNKVLTEFFSQPEFKWLDGEMIMPDTDGIEGRQCSLVTGATNSPRSQVIPDIIVFDYLDPEMVLSGYTYEARYAELAKLVPNLQNQFGPNKVRLMPYYPVETMERVLELDAEFLEQGLEGSILRNHLAHYKEGRPSTKTQELMRIKRFIDFEFTIDALEEAMENTNEAKTNELGRTERSTAKEGMVPKGMVGKFKGRFHGDVVHNGKVLFKDGEPVTVGPGQSTHDERRLWWQQPGLVVGEIGKGKFFPHQLLSAARMPIFLSLRAAEDMS